MFNSYAKSIAITLAAVLFCSCAKKTADAVALETPSPVVAATGANYVLLMWEAVEHASSYELLVDDKTVIKTEETTAYINGLSADSQHQVAVKSLAPEGSTGWKDSEYCTPLVFTTSGKEALAAPVVEAVSVLPNRIVLAWKAVSGAGSYKYSLDEGPEQETTEPGVTIENLRYSTSYTFKVKAVPDASSAEYYKESAWSQITVETADPVKLDTPELEVKDVTPNGFVILWDSIQYADHYLYSVNDGPAASVNETSVVIDGLTASTEYTVKVCAVPSSGDEGSFISSDWAEIKATTLDIIELDAPVLVASNVLDNQFTVSWDKIDNAAEYMYSLNGAEYKSTGETSLTFTELSPETDYSLKVKAVPSAEGTKTYKESKVSEIVVRTKKPASDDDKGGDLSDYDEGPLF